MAKYILLMNWTDQGIKTVKESPTRLDTARAAAKGQGITMGDFYMTMGGHDMVLHVDAPDDTALAKFILKVAQAGAIRTTTLKAFSEDEYRSIVGSV